MVYYANIEGIVEDSGSEEFGFFVHCLIAVDDELTGMKKIREALRAEG